MNHFIATFLFVILMTGISVSSGAQEKQDIAPHSGFGESLFSHTAPPGFQDPVLDPSEVLMIEPAAGDEIQEEDMSSLEEGMPSDSEPLSQE